MATSDWWPRPRVVASNNTLDWARLTTNPPPPLTFVEWAAGGMRAMEAAVTAAPLAKVPEAVEFLALMRRARAELDAAGTNIDVDEWLRTLEDDEDKPVSVAP